MNVTAAQLNAAIKTASDEVIQRDRQFNEAFRKFGAGSPELRAATEANAGLGVVAVGNVEVKATMGGNSRRQHIRLTFKIDGKRASRADVEKLAASA